MKPAAANNPVSSSSAVPTKTRPSTSTRPRARPPAPAAKGVSKPEPKSRPEAAGKAFAPKASASRASASKAPMPLEPAPQATPEKAAKPPKVRLVRDSFTMPEADFSLVAVLKARALGLGRSAKKSELLRAGLQLLSQQEPAALLAALERLQPIKTGRPKKGD